MPEDTQKVPAQDVLGTAWEKNRKCRPVDESDIKIEVFFVNQDRTQDALEPLEGRADREDIAKLYGPGRFYLRAKKRSDGSIISQTLVDIKPDEAPRHPMAVVAPPKQPPTEIPEEDEDRISRLEAAILEIGEKIEARQAAPAGQTVLDRVFEKLLMDKISAPTQPNPMQSPEVFGEMMKSMLATQASLMTQQLELRGDEKRYELEMRRIKDERQMVREDLAFETRQKLLIEQAKAVQGQATFDPSGDNTMSLVEALQDMIGLDKSMQVFGMNIAEMIAPVVPQFTKALQDRDIYILSKKQLETLMAHQFDQGRATGQQEALSGLEEAEHGPAGGSTVPEPADDPGPDDQAGSGEGSAGEPDAGSASAD